VLVMMLLIFMLLLLFCVTGDDVTAF
jgi:hypothetical protein